MNSILSQYESMLSGYSRVVLLLSGGIESVTALAVLSNFGKAVHAVSFDYNQRHRQELFSAAFFAKEFQVADHRTVKLDMTWARESALVGDALVPMDRKPNEMARSSVYVPGRNLVFLSVASSIAEAIRADAIVIGACATDSRAFSDCRPVFFNAFQRTLMCSLGDSDSQAVAIAVLAPFTDISKPEVVRLGRSLGLDYGRTFSCYSPSPEGLPCTRCDACVLRAESLL